MPSLYNMRHSGDQYRITKFDTHYEAESSYLCTESECNCPAGVRPSCRHRQMLPKFLARDMIGKNFFFDFDRGGWVQGPAEWEEQVEAGSEAARHASNRAVLEAGGTLTTEYMVDGSINEYATIEHEPRAVPASPSGEPDPSADLEALHTLAQDLPKAPIIRRRI